MTIWYNKTIVITVSRNYYHLNEHTSEMSSTSNIKVTILLLCYCYILVRNNWSIIQFLRNSREAIYNCKLFLTHPQENINQRIPRSYHKLLNYDNSLRIPSLFNPLSANPTKWSNKLKQFFANLLTICFSVFDHFVGLALKGLKIKFAKMFCIGFCFLLLFCCYYYY